MLPWKPSLPCAYHVHFVQIADWSPDRTGTARLVGGPDGSTGRLEIFTNDVWGSVCDQGWHSADAAVVCRELGYDGVVVYADQGSFGSSGGAIAGSNVGCIGTETFLSLCSYSIDVASCSHSNDVAIVCQSK